MTEPLESREALIAFRRDASNNPTHTSTSVWQPVTYANQHRRLAIKIAFAGDSLQMMVTDHRHLWTDTLQKWKSRFQALNPNLEGDVDDAVDWIRNVFSGTSASTVTFDESMDHKFVIRYLATFSQLPFQWQFVGSETSADEFYDQVTAPLFLLVHEINRRSEQLVEIIESKDREIADYRLSGVETSKSDIRTARFTYREWRDDVGISEDAISATRLCLELADISQVVDNVNYIQRDALLCKAFVQSLPEPKFRDIGHTDDKKEDDLTETAPQYSKQKNYESSSELPKAARKLDPTPTDAVQKKKKKPLRL